LGANPFHPDTPAHEAFIEATWKAKTAIAKFKLEFPGAGLAEFVQSALTFRKRWFTTCAFEATLIAGNEETARWYENWTDRLADSLLEDTLNAFKRKDPSAERSAEPPFNADDLPSIESDLKLDLMKMLVHYKGVAARRVTEVISLRQA
jgi:hypothetical protein